MSSLFLFPIFFGEILSIYFLSRLVLRKAYGLLSRFGSKKMIVGIISFLYLPGTITHELSHYFAAVFLNMRTHEVSIFPVIEEKKIKLGHVIYEKNPGDFLRPILIGIAPLFGALITLSLIVYTKQFPGKELWQTVVFGYLILAITANMFSSAQDLVDVIYLIPIGIIIALLLYLFPFSIPTHYLSIISNAVNLFLQTIQPALLFSIVLHVILVAILSRLQ